MKTTLEVLNDKLARLYEQRNNIKLINSGIKRELMNMQDAEDRLVEAKDNLIKDLDILENESENTNTEGMNTLCDEIFQYESAIRAYRNRMKDMRLLSKGSLKDVNKRIEEIKQAIDIISTRQESENTLDSAKWFNWF